MPAITTRGAASAKAFGWSSGGGPVIYIEEVFSTYLYTGTGATQTITNGIDLSTKGGMIWFKSRTSAQAHGIVNTLTGVNTNQNSNSTGAAQDITGDFSSFNSTGFTLLAPTMTSNFNGSTEKYTSWTFRKQPKFFDIVTYTGDGIDPKTLNHNLQSIPGCIIIKCTSTTSNWRVHSTSLDATLVLNLTNAAFIPDGLIKNLTSTTFDVNNSADVNSSGATYVAYLFAHNAGGFGLSGGDNVISCGSYTGNGSATGPVVTLGYEPQWLLIRKSSNTGNWQIMDNMRGLPVGSADATLQANLTNIETSVEYVSPTATGFQITSTNTEVNTSAATYIYIAIRRGPMKVPTVGTQVYKAQSRTGNDSTGSTLTAQFPPDLIMSSNRDSTIGTWLIDKLIGISQGKLTSSTAAEVTDAGNVTSFEMKGFSFGSGAGGWTNGLSYTYVYNYFGRAPGFFDEVCWTNTGATQSISHNLGVAPELIIAKRRPSVENWQIYSATTGASAYLTFTTAAVVTGNTNRWNATSPTASVFTTGTAFQTAETYVAYLFATLAGISKVGSYTGNGSNQTIACGFAAGSRFVMIKRTDSTGDWYVWDSERGIVAGDDPHISLNSAAAEVTTDDSVDTDNSGFIVNQLAATNINVTSATYIFLAIA